MDDVVLNKAATIERCIARIRDKYVGGKAFEDDLDNQDLIVLNIQRAVQAAIDMATHVVRVKKWGIPQSYGENFEILYKQEAITQELADKLIAMVGFKNIAIHDYQRLNSDIVVSIIDYHLSDLETFSSTIVKVCASTR